MQDVELIQKELSELIGRKARLGSPEETEDERLRDLERQIAEHEARMAELKRLITEKEAKVDWTAAEEAERARLQRLIDEEEAEVAEWQAKVTELEPQVPLWKARSDTAKALAKALGAEAEWHKFRPYVRIISEVGLNYLNAWGDEALDRIAEFRGAFEGLATVLIPIETARMGKGRLEYEQIPLAEKTHYDFYTELRNAKDELERAKRRLWDAKAALERYELAIERAIALRQAEVDAAKARHELELRTLDNLKATYNALLKEIEAARTQAIAEAARQREEVIKAKEEDRLSIAEEQRRIAEEYERLAAESAGIEREEYLDKMRRAEDIAEEAEEAAIAAAKEREALAVDIATRKAELARIELDLEELRKQLAITAERKEEAEKKVAGLPAIPKWGWIALGVGGITATAGGIAYAVKKKKEKVK